MYQVLHHGVDTLDIAFQGAFPDTTLKALEAAADEARATNKEQSITIGPDAVRALVAPNGMKGGFRYVFNTGPAGAIFAVKANIDIKEWNLFVSIRALRLLTLGYADTKIWLHETLAGMGFITTDVSINRIDFAVDILAPNFKLDVANFVMPSHTKARPYWSKDQLLTDDGYRPKAVIRGRQFESVTIGSMPNRQLIVYDKRRAAIDLRQLYWFEVWDVDKDDPSSRIWRVEIRGGRDALAKRMIKRSYEAVEHDLRAYLIKAATDIRYVTDKEKHSNVSRTNIHPLWDTLTKTLSEIPISPKPPIPEARAMEIIREQRMEMSLKQGIGNLFNYMLLSGEEPEMLAKNLSKGINDASSAYQRIVPKDELLERLSKAKTRLMFLQV